MRLDGNFGFLFFYFAAWYETQQNKGKPDPEIANTNKIRVSLNEINFMAFFVGVVANLYATFF